MGVNDVLTAMHVVYDASRGGWARDILIRPAADTWPTLQQPLGAYTDWGEIDARTQDWDRDGDGLVTTAEAQWDLALIGLQSRIGDSTGWVHAAPAVADYLRGEESHSLAELEVFIGKQVRVVSDPLCGQEQFDVVMM